MVFPGRPYPHGAICRDGGVNFAIFSEHARKVFLCLFNSAEPPEETDRIELIERTDFIWHCFIPGLSSGQRYGYRMDGDFDPGAGMRYNASKLLLDPYARLIVRPPKVKPDLCASVFLKEEIEGVMEESEVMNTSDTADIAPLGAVYQDDFDWHGDVRPDRPLQETILYELHVKGFTKLNRKIDPSLRGTYAGLASDVALDYLKKLGITAVELMPVHYSTVEQHLLEKGLSNYWGYNTLSFFMPDPRYAVNQDPEGSIREFKEMVKRLHGEGIEVILDVVYNHTAEGNQYGPMLSLRGIDDSIYYRKDADNPAVYVNYTGCGNTLNLYNMQTLHLVMESLRYWVNEMHVDGFRFDLAASLGRAEDEFDRNGPFFQAVYQDPVLSRVKLIAEPWDLGPEGDREGSYPLRWAEWNGKYRDTIRRTWRGDPGIIADFATRISGSSDLFGLSGRSPVCSINYVCSHDGFTLYDLVSYNEKYNEENQEGNRDGTELNYSWNSGAEGDTSDHKILTLRYRRMRSMMATLLLSQGTPMIYMGDERGRTQRGNNNPYCQDNETSWMEWELNPSDKNFLEFTSRMIHLRKGNFLLSKRRFFNGHNRDLSTGEKPDVIWYSSSGNELSEEEWMSGELSSICFYLMADYFAERSFQDGVLPASSLLIIVNPALKNIRFRLPRLEVAAWKRLLDTRMQFFDEKDVIVKADQEYPLSGMSLVILEPLRD